MAIHLASWRDHATCCDSSELTELNNDRLLDALSDYVCLRNRVTNAYMRKGHSTHSAVHMQCTELKINERIEYKLLSLIHEVLTATYAYLNDMILLYVKSLRPKLATESTAVTPARPSTSCSSRYK